MIAQAGTKAERPSHDLYAIVKCGGNGIGLQRSLSKLCTGLSVLLLGAFGPGILTTRF